MHVPVFSTDIVCSVCVCTISLHAKLCSVVNQISFVDVLQFQCGHWMCYID